MPITNLSELRTLYPPPKAQAGLKVLDHLDVHCRAFIALPRFTSSVPPERTAGPTPRPGETRRDCWLQWWTRKPCSCRTGLGTARSTRCRTWWSGRMWGCYFSFRE